jgi:hypothetical protein
MAFKTVIKLLPGRIPETIVFCYAITAGLFGLRKQMAPLVMSMGKS